MGESRDDLRVGIVGAGTISKAYLKVLAEEPGVQVVAVADLEPERARAVADSHAGIRALTPEQLYGDPEVETVLNLTIPAAHASVALAALDAGKHVYGEKPLAATRQEARPILELASRSGLRVGCAPDTVLGRGFQTARALLDRGDIGVPVAATAFCASPGPDRWHPNVEFYYQPGGGPLFDMGPYYLTALISLLGPVRTVVGRASRARDERVVGSGPKQGTRFPVQVETHVTGVLEHHSGVLSTVIHSFDVPGHKLPRIEVYGSDGTLSVPDPNRFEGEVGIFRSRDDPWQVVEPAGGYPDTGRGIGVADLARAIRTGGPHRANGELAYHVLDLMESMLESAAQKGSPVDVASTCERPEAVPLNVRPDQA